ncbi:MAG: hypothetical protein JXA41_08625 [Deltaproteobacteria bacterium]|nr:hypothetical protein [Deltaproteobacteria bacterium]
MKIHIVSEAKNNFFKLNENEWESGWWLLDESKAQELIGGEIYFHKKRQEPSFYGGTILGYRVDQGEHHRGRIIFKLKYEKSCRNVRTDKSGWSKEIKIIRSQTDSEGVKENG